MQRLVQFTLPAAILLIIVFHSTESLTCIPCGEENRCPKEAPICTNGHVLDICHCCLVCGKGEGEVCGGPWDLRGKCGDGLVCVSSRAIFSEGECRAHKTKRSLIYDEDGPQVRTIPPPVVPDWHLDLVNALSYKNWVKNRLG